MPVEILIGIALLFAVATGANDGGALLAPGLRVPGLGLLPAAAILIVATVVVPFATAAPVARTLTSGLVDGSMDGATAGSGAGSVALAVAFVVAVVVVLLLTARGLPTSLILAVIPATVGAGLGLGVPVSWASVWWVLLIAAVAPLVGIVLALAVSMVWSTRGRYLPTMRRGHVLAFSAQSLAYGANDGQKIFVLLIAAGLANPDGRLTWWWYLLLGVAFAAGVALGLPRIARTVGTGILNARPAHIVSGEFAAAGAVLGSAAVGAPVSMTQAIVGGLLGAGLRESSRRIRWHVVRGLGLAWVLTLPLSFGLAALGGLAVAALR